MSSLPSNPYGSNTPPSSTDHQIINSNVQQFNQGSSPTHNPGLKHGPVSNSPVRTTPILNNDHGSYNSSSNNSPAFNRPGILPPPPAGMLPPGSLPPGGYDSRMAPTPGNPPLSNNNAPSSTSANFQQHLNNAPQFRQINSAAPPIVPNSRPLVNGPPHSESSVPSSVSQFPSTHMPPTSSTFIAKTQPPGALPPMHYVPPTMQSNAPPIGSAVPATSSNLIAFAPPNINSMPHFNSSSAFSPISKPNATQLQPTQQVSNLGQQNMNVMSPIQSQPLPSVASNMQQATHQSNVSQAPIRNNVLPPGPPVSHPPLGVYQPHVVNGLSSNVMARPPMMHPQGLPARQITSGQVNGPPRPAAPMGTGLPPASVPAYPTSQPPVHASVHQQMNNKPPSLPQGYQGPLRPGLPQTTMPPAPGPTSAPTAGLPQHPIGLVSQPQANMPPQGTPGMPVGKTMQNRYPQMPQANYNSNQTAQLPQQPMAYPQQQYNNQGVAGMTQQMGQMSVTKQGFDQLWGHQMVDLMQCKHILPEYPEPPPEIRLGPQFADASNCSPDVFRSTINRIPETNSLLQKSRLPLGILIHPFKDLDYLPVIQCATIVRCRACRTYINPFVYFVDSKRWKCNLCFRINDLPEEFQYDPVSKSYGDPTRRPEVKSATIEFIAPSEYMLRPPQPAIYLFLLDVSQLARESGYVEVFCKTLAACLEQLPGDARTQVGFICYDSHIHYYLMSEGLNRPKEMTVLDIDDVFLPSPEALLVNLVECRDLIKELLTILPKRYSLPGVPASALGAALQAAYKLMAPTGGRITVIQTCLPNVGPGALQAREDPNARSSKEVSHLNPATDFYKRLALDCSGVQVAVDLFLLNSQYSDLATLSGMSKFSGGSVYHIPLFKASRPWQQEQFTRSLTRYLTRKIGFEAVMRVRCTRGVNIHTFHGNFFVRSTDLLSLPNVSPDAGFGMQLVIEESLSDLQHVCFQAALLYTSSKGERRIRVHTLALPIATNLTEVLNAADQECIVGLLCKMAVDRCQSASMSEAREALINVAVDVLSANRLAQNLPVTAFAPLLAPACLRLLPMYILAALKRVAFRTGTSTRLDDRVADMCELKAAPLARVLRAILPALYPLHKLPADHNDSEDRDVVPPRLQLTHERINSNGAYLLDDGETMIIYVCHNVSPSFLADTFGVSAFSQLPDEARSVPRLQRAGSQTLHALIDDLNEERPHPANLLVLRDNSPSRHLFTERLIEDRIETSFSYYEFLQHIKSQVK